jgi:hypothetical protein
MINQTHELIGPAARVLGVSRALANNQGKIAILLDGNPGCGKSHLLDQLALELTGSKFSVETINGQSLKIEVVRDWRMKSCYGNLFSDWTVKRIDELDQASLAAQSELLTYLDYLPARFAVLASTNEYSALRAASKGRLETRFNRFRVDAPSIDEATDYITKRFNVVAGVASQIALGSVPDGCLASEGVNMRACIKDVESYLAARDPNGKPTNRPN